MCSLSYVMQPRGMSAKNDTGAVVPDQVYVLITDLIVNNHVRRKTFGF